MRIILAVLLLLPSLSFAQYPGYVFTRLAATCSGLNNSWHWQCLPGTWKPFAEVLPIDMIATCDTPSSPTGCGNTGVNRRWLLSTSLSATTKVLQCSVTPNPLTGNAYTCPTAKQYFLAAGEPIPGTTEPPPGPIPPPTNPQAFTNIFSSVTPVIQPVTMHFWIGLMDYNDDGRNDIFVGTHNDTTTPSALYLQTELGQLLLCEALVCRHSQPNPVTTRCTSRFVFANLFNREDGLWSYLCHDADAVLPAKYAISGIENGLPIYEDKAPIGVPTGTSVLPISRDAGTVELSAIRRAYVSIVDPETAEINSVTPASICEAGTITFDVDNDGYPEFIRPACGGYFDSSMNWQADKFIGALPDPLASVSHAVPGDFNKDGYQDLIFIQVPYSNYPGLNGGSDVAGTFKGPQVATPFYFRNNQDGTFTNVTAGSGLENRLKATYFFSSYASSFSTDLNLDGSIDWVYVAETRTHSPVWHDMTYMPLVYGNGNNGFSVDKSVNFGGFDTDSGAGRPWASFGDFENDGDVDIVKTQGLTSAGLWIDSRPRVNKYLGIRVSGAGTNTDGLHATVIIRDPITHAIITSTQIGHFTTGFNNLRPIVGTGSFSVVDIDVIMPNGLPSMHFDDITTNRSIHITPQGIQ
jgi:hypothetical protein